MKVLIIDNYDSFTYNIAHYVEQFACLCHVIKIDEIELETIETYDKIILSPGPGLPSERPLLNEIIERFHQKKPILGICLGHQAIAEYFGCQLFNMPEVHHGIAKKNQILISDYLFEHLPQTFNTGRYHSWAVDSIDFSDALDITIEDSENKTIMAFSHKHLDIKGVQFHPESVLTEHGLKIIENWVKQ